MTHSNAQQIAEFLAHERQELIAERSLRIEEEKNKPLMLEVTTALSQQLRDHFSKQDYQFIIQDKALNFEETFGLNGLLAIFISALDDQIDELASGLKWYLVPCPEALAEVSLRINCPPFEFDAIERIRNAIVQLVGSLDVTCVSGIYRCPIDPLYESFYMKGEESALDIESERAGQNEPASVIAKQLFGKKSFDEAQALMEKVCRIRKGLLGNTHPSTLEANRQSAACLLANGEHQMALSLLEFNVSALTDVHGEFHEETLQAQGRLAKACSTMGLAVRSTEILEAALLKSNTYLGERHDLSIKLSAELNSIRKTHSGEREQGASEEKTCISVCDAKLFHARLEQESDKDNGKRLSGLRGITKPKKLLRIPAQALLEIERLGAEQPNFAEVTELIINTLHAQMITGRSAQLPPMLLSGAPGVGKTRYIKRIAKILGAPFADIQLAGVPDAFRISGLSRYWGTAGEGMIANLFATQDIANPIFLMDEIDKTKKDEKSDPLSVILLLLERESAKSFKDSFVDIPLDVSHASFIATANDIDELPDPLVSRFHCIEVSPLDYSGRCTMVKTTYQELLEQEGFKGFLSPELAQGTLETLAGCEELNGRELKREILLGMQRACRELKVGQMKISAPLLAQHLRLPEVKVARPMGFA